MKARLNLATSPLETHRKFWLGAAVVGAVAGIALVLLAWHAVAVQRANNADRARRAAVQQQLADLQRQRRGLDSYFNLPQVREVRDRAAFLNGLISQRSFPWTKIFMDLERSLPVGVRVVSISPQMDAGRVEVKLVVGAMNDEAKLKFLRALESSPDFSNVQLIAETHPTRADEADQVRLELIAWYVTS